MQAFSLHDMQEFNPQRHVEKILGRVADGDVTLACWEPGQISPYHSHPEASENGPQRTLLFRVRYGPDMRSVSRGWRQPGVTAGPS